MEHWPPWLTLALISMLCHDGMAQPAFTIDWVKLTLFPTSTVETGTDVTLRCEAKVSHRDSQLIHTFIFKMDNTVIYAKNTTEAVVERNLAPTRAANSGSYKCYVQIHTKEMSSKPQTLTVTGLQTPQLKVHSDKVFEGDKVTVTCSAPDEAGSLRFYFFKNGEEFNFILSSSNSVNITVEFQELGQNHLHCNYRLALHRSDVVSNNSNTVEVIVQEYNITPSIKITPKSSVVEGDRVEITCNVSGYSQSDLHVFLIKDKVLHTSHTTFMHSFQVKSEHSGEYVCKAEKGNLQKSSTARMAVAELFSVPVLRVTPEQVFEGQALSLNCWSPMISQNRISYRDVKYKLYESKRLIKREKIFNTTASQNTNGNYTCVAEAKGISKTSNYLIVTVSVPVSVPVIYTVGNVIVKQPFQIRCESKSGTLPITYTLLKSQIPVDTKTVTGPLRSALFNVSFISHKEEIYSFACLAQNQGAGYSKTSNALNAVVIEPVSRPELTLQPKGHAFAEGMVVTLSCSVQQGTVPVNFAWYRNENHQPLEVKHSSKTQETHIIQYISRDHRGSYYCTASNEANTTKKSAVVTIGVSLAGWKKAVIAVICILILVIIVTILVLFLKKAQAPRKRKKAIELSVKPARPKSSDPMRMSLTLDIEDNTAINTTPGLMGKNVWSENVSDSESDDASKQEECEELQYTEVYPKQTEDPEKAPMMQETDMANGEVQDCTHGATDESATDSAVEYVQLNHAPQDPE